MGSSRKKRKTTADIYREGFEEGQKIAREALGANIDILKSQQTVSICALESFVEFTETYDPKEYQRAVKLAEVALSKAKKNGLTEWIRRIRVLIFSTEQMLLKDKSSATQLKKKVEELREAIRQVQPLSALR